MVAVLAIAVSGLSAYIYLRPSVEIRANQSNFNNNNNNMASSNTNKKANTIDQNAARKAAEEAAIKAAATAGIDDYFPIFLIPYKLYRMKF